MGLRIHIIVNLSKNHPVLVLSQCVFGYHPLLRNTTTLFFAKPLPPSLNLQTVQAPLFSTLGNSPYILAFISFYFAKFYLINSLRNSTVQINFHFLRISSSDSAFQVTDDLLETYNSILNAEPVVIETAQAREGTSTQLLRSLDTLAAKLSATVNTTTYITIEKENLAFTMRKIEKKNVEIFARNSQKFSSLGIGDENLVDIQTDENILSLIKIPLTVFPTQNEVIHSFYFKERSLFSPVQTMRPTKTKDVNVTELIQSVVLSASVTSTRIANLTDPIVLTFKESYFSIVPGISQCKFYDFDLGM